jgi:ABC-type branched-subunit amino acid transport system substrate-binding protein
MWLGVVVVCGCIASTYWYVFRAPTPAATTPLVIGVIVPLSGENAALGASVQNALELAVTSLNGGGGIRGRNIELQVRNGGCTEAEARQAVLDLIAAGVTYLYAGVCDSEFLAAAPLTQTGQIISFTSAAAGPDLETLGPLVFRTLPSDTALDRIAAVYAIEVLDTKTVVVVADTPSSLRRATSIFNDVFATSGRSVIATATMSATETGGIPVAKRTALRGANAVYLVVEDTERELEAIQAMRQEGIQTPIIVTTSHAHEGEKQDNVFRISPYFDGKRDRTRDFLERYATTFGAAPPYPIETAGAYDGLFLLAEAAQATNGSTVAVFDYITTLGAWEGSVGQLTFNTTGDPDTLYQVHSMQGGVASSSLIGSFIK